MNFKSPRHKESCYELVVMAIGAAIVVLGVVMVDWMNGLVP